MTLKETNNLLEEVIDNSLAELSRLYSKQVGEKTKFEFWTLTHSLDLDKNQTVQFVLDVRAITPEGKVRSWKRIFDRMTIQRENIARNEDGSYNTEKPEYAKKQRNFEESRNTVLRELLAKSLSGFALGMAVRTKDEIVAFNDVDKLPVTEDEAYKVE